MKWSVLIVPPTDFTVRAIYGNVQVKSGLGLKPQQGAVDFVDVKTSDWYSDAVRTAQQYQLITGFEDGCFQPMELLTREQAKVIISKEMTLTGLKELLPIQNTNVTLQQFTDDRSVARWTRDDVAPCIIASIVTGQGHATIAAKANVTRAEVITMLQQLLKKSDLIA